jgi:hypothetical protein
MNPEPCVLLVRGSNAYEVVQFNREVGKLVLRSQYGIEMAVTAERADQNGYKAVRGFKHPDPKVEGRMRYTPQ